jgi:uncharacterized protein
MQKSKPMALGVISDTHGSVRPEALEALRGCERIVHAGDISGADVLSELAAVAPITAVRGNNDHGPWADDVPHERVIEFGGFSIYVVHEPAHVPDDVVARGYDVVVTGHTHRPSIERRDGVLFVNPGSAGPRRFTLPVTLARLWVADGALESELVEIVPPV